jgi:hypothetical protein
LPGDDLLTTLLELRSFPRRRHIAPLDFIGTIGQLNGPKSQLTNNIWLHCHFLSFWAEKLLGLAGPNLLVIATSVAPARSAPDRRVDVVVRIKSVLGVIQIGFEPS